MVVTEDSLSLVFYQQDVFTPLLDGRCNAGAARATAAVFLRVGTYPIPKLWALEHATEAKVALSNFADDKLTRIYHTMAMPQSGRCRLGQTNNVTPKRRVIRLGPQRLMDLITRIGFTSPGIDILEAKTTLASN